MIAHVEQPKRAPLWEPKARVRWSSVRREWMWQTACLCLSVGLIGCHSASAAGDAARHHLTRHADSEARS